MDTGLFIMYGFLVLLAAGIFIYAKLMIAKNRKGNNMDYGLLEMYIFLALIAVGSFIYVKIEDKKEQKNS